MERKIIVLVGSWNREEIIRSLKEALIMIEKSASEVVALTFPQDKHVEIICEKVHANDPLTGPHLVILEDNSPQTYLERIILEKRNQELIQVIKVERDLGEVVSQIKPARKNPPRPFKGKSNHWPKTKNGRFNNSRGRSQRDR